MLRSCAATLFSAFLFSSFAAAASITSVVVYGDSLSDNGNLYAVAGQPGPPYYNGRVSNGPVAVEQLATDLGASLHDFAFAGATTGAGNTLDGGTTTSFGTFNLPGMLTSYSATSASIAPLINTGTLFIVWGGPDDLLSPSPLDTTAGAIVNRSVSDILAIVAGLKAQGATNILVPGMADLGLTPDYSSQGPLAAAQASAFSALFNTDLQIGLSSTGALFFNTTGLLDSVVASPSSYGFTNVTQPCFNQTAGTLCSNPNQYLFFDSLHPTTAADALIAQSFLATLAPEPKSMMLSALALAVMGALVFSRRRRGVARF